MTLSTLAWPKVYTAPLVIKLSLLIVGTVSTFVGEVVSVVRLAVRES